MILCAELDQALSDANIIISTPFHPAYMTRDRILNSPQLELIITAGVGSDHIDLHAAAEKGITVAEVISPHCARRAVALCEAIVVACMQGYLSHCL